MGLSMVEHSVLCDHHRKKSEEVQLWDLWDPGAERQTMLNPIRLRMGLTHGIGAQPGRLNKKRIVPGGRATNDVFFISFGITLTVHTPSLFCKCPILKTWTHTAPVG